MKWKLFDWTVTLDKLKQRRTIISSSTLSLAGNAVKLVLVLASVGHSYKALGDAWQFLCSNPSGETFYFGFICMDDI